MRAMLIVEADEFLRDVIEMAEAEAKEVIQTFAFYRPDPGFREGVCVGGE